jgi:hypothetical protein
MRDESWSLFLVVLSGSFFSLEHDERQMLESKSECLDPSHENGKNMRPTENVRKGTRRGAKA